MKKEGIFILGTGGMAREVRAYYDDSGDLVKGFVEQDSRRSGQDQKGVAILDANELPNPDMVKLIGGIGSPLRREWIEQLEVKGYQFDSFIHKEAYVGKEVKLGRGCIVCPGAIITTDVHIGIHCIINIRACISHDCALGDYITVSPGATIGGRVHIGDETWIGIGATVIQDVKIGKRVFIAAGAVVVTDLPDDSLVVGIPAKVVRKLTPESWKTLI